MMAEFKVRKGMESPLLVYGFQLRHFYILLAILIAHAVLTGVLLMSLVGGGGSFFAIVAYFIIGIVAIGVLASFFSSKANSPKHSFNKRISQVTNRDFLEQLR